jgi:hypothetical protein
MSVVDPRVTECLLITALTRRHRDEPRAKIAEDMLSDARIVFPTLELPTLDEFLAMDW